MSRRYIFVLAVGIGIILGLPTLALKGQNEHLKRSFRPNIPKVWDESALIDWATPVAGLNVRPTHVSQKDYYALPIDNLRTYPVYYPGREPEGYWEKLQHYLHDGSAASLEEMFDPDRLKDSHVPEGWNPPGMQTRAIKGHEFGLNLTPSEREQLIAFLKTL